MCDSLVYLNSASVQNSIGMRIGFGSFGASICTLPTIFHRHHPHRSHTHFAQKLSKIFFPWQNKNGKLTNYDCFLLFCCVLQINFGHVGWCGVTSTSKCRQYTEFFFFAFVATNHWMLSIFHSFVILFSSLELANEELFHYCKRVQLTQIIPILKAIELACVCVWNKRLWKGKRRKNSARKEEKQGNGIKFRSHLFW